MTSVSNSPCAGFMLRIQCSSNLELCGFLPADDPQVSVLIKLDRPDGYWGS